MFDSTVDKCLLQEGQLLGPRRAPCLAKMDLVIFVEKIRFFKNAVLHKYYGLQECVLVEPSICTTSQNLKTLVIAKNRMSSNDFSPTTATKTY